MEFSKGFSCQLACAVFISALLLIDPVDAHSWYDEECCDGKDCHPVDCDAISEEPDGFHWHYGPRRSDALLFTHSQLRPSRDGYCHVCHQMLFNGNPSNPICIYLRQTT